jgi:AcrR family transcriptional regulator
MGRPPKVDARNTREDILGAALDLFAQHGYAGTSVRQIAQAVGVAESALYYHFSGGKDAIWQAVMDDTITSRTAPFRQIDMASLDASSDVGAIMHDLTDRMLDGWSTPREQKLFQMLMREGFPAFNKAIRREDFERAVAAIEGFFAELVRHGLVADIAPRVLSTQFMGPLFLLRIYNVYSGGDDIRGRRSEAHQHVEMFLKAVRR